MRAGGRHQATVGIIAHELGHDLGMPDLYDPDRSAADRGGVGSWSLMASGSWNAAPGGFSGSSPAHPRRLHEVVHGLDRPAAGERNGERGRARPSGEQPARRSPARKPERRRLELRRPLGLRRVLPAREPPADGLRRGPARLRRPDLAYRRAAPSATTTPTPTRTASVWSISRKEITTTIRAAPPTPGRLRGEFNDSSSPNARLYSGAFSGVKGATVSTACAGTMTVNTADGSAVGVPNDNFAAATAAGRSRTRRPGSRPRPQPSRPASSRRHAIRRSGARSGGASPRPRTCA